MKELEVVVTYPDDENNDYEYKGYPLTVSISRELTLLLFEGKGVFKHSDIVRSLMDFHQQHGGDIRTIVRSRTVVGKALLSLKNDVLAINKSKGYWEVPYVERMVGQGDSSVYVFYFSSDRENAISKGQVQWRCKIGYTTGNPYDRVKDQVGVVPERPRVPLVIQNIQAQTLEQHIHQTLSKKGRHVKEAQGTEWFITTPREVEDIYRDWVIQSL